MTSTRQNNSGGLAGESLSIQERQQQEEHDAKMELSRVQIELATAQLRMAEDEHRIRFAKLQVELQMAQMEHDAKAQQLSWVMQFMQIKKMQISVFSSTSSIMRWYAICQLWII